ncbi:hypothetical protein ACA910_017482 [Epithemia clementina (nom. ined.)]
MFLRLRPSQRVMLLTVVGILTGAVLLLERQMLHNGGWFVHTTFLTNAQLTRKGYANQLDQEHFSNSNNNHAILIRKQEEQNVPTFTCPLEPCHLNIVFLGDSLTRFMYISLAYFFSHNNTWMDPTGMMQALSSTTNSTEGGSSALRTIFRPSDYLNASTGNELEADLLWTPWFQASHALLQPGEVACDCYRKGGPNWLKDIVENRYYYNSYRNITLTYLMAFGNAVPVRGHWKQPPNAAVFGSASNINHSSTYLHHQREIRIFPKEEFAWSGNWSHAIRNHIRWIRPNALVLNAGLWSHSFGSSTVSTNRNVSQTTGSSSKVKQFRHELVQDCRDAQIPRVIWKTTTARRLGDRYPQHVQKTDEAMCDLFDQYNSSSSHSSASCDGVARLLVQQENKSTIINRTISQHCDDDDSSAEENQDARGGGCLNISMWTRWMPERKVYVDKVHFLEPVYRKMNEQLLDTLGVHWDGGDRETWLNQFIPEHDRVTSHGDLMRKSPAR